MGKIYEPIWGVIIPVWADASIGHYHPGTYRGRPHLYIEVYPARKVGPRHYKIIGNTGYTIRLPGRLIKRFEEATGSKEGYVFLYMAAAFNVKKTGDIFEVTA